MVPLPDELKEKINDLVAHKPLSTLAASSKTLTEKYRSGERCRFMQSEGERLAYLLARMPATFAALAHVLTEAAERAPLMNLDSLLDLGAGPGTGMWAAGEVFPRITKVTLFERDRDLISLGKKLAAGKGHWIEGDLEKTESFEPHDLVLLSYALGELKGRIEVARRAWQAARKLLVIVEPGTPEGFSKLRLIRDQMIAEGAHLIAPCPHAQSCPMQAGDWCHFAERLARTAVHRKIKGAALGHEDEKFFYLIFSKDLSNERAQGRILRHPIKHPGYVEMTVCTQCDGVQRKIISRKDKEKFRAARKAEWGEEIKFFCAR